MFVFSLTGTVVNLL
jgi:hypothetical protein